jgi:hypothetical protein
VRSATHGKDETKATVLPLGRRIFPVSSRDLRYKRDDQCSEATRCTRRRHVHLLGF